MPFASEAVFKKAKEVVMRILVADDEIEITKVLRTILEHQKYSVDTVHTGEDALTYALSGKYDGIILDIMMPQMTGLEVLQKIRAEKCSTPVMLLTARDDLESRVTGLDAGADDYLQKPFATTEFLARVRAMLRRGESYISEELSFGNLVLNCTTYELQTPYGVKHLCNKEYQIMSLFLRNPKAVFSSAEIMERIWGWESAAEINVVWSNITYLRKKLKQLKADVEIKSIRNVGYCLSDLHNRS